MNRQNSWALAASAILFAVTASVGHADEKAKPRPQPPPIALPALAELPKADDLSPPTVRDRLAPERTTDESPTYAVSNLVHAKSFLQSRRTALPMGGALNRISLGGKPPSTEKFATAVRVKASRKENAAIEVLVLDPRGEVAMSASGELRFRQAKRDELDYIVEWDSVPCRWTGDFLVAVRVGGKPMGTWPLKVVEQNAGLGNTSARKF